MRNCNGCIAAVEREVTTCSSEIEAEQDRKQRQFLRLHRSYLRKDIKDFEKRRDYDIGRLREKQGV